MFEGQPSQNKAQTSPSKTVVIPPGKKITGSDAAPAVLGPMAFSGARMWQKMGEHWSGVLMGKTHGGKNKKQPKTVVGA